VEIIDDEERMLPYLQSLINKYRVPVGFDEYISRPGRSREKEMAVVRVCVITPREVTSRKMVRARLFRNLTAYTSGTQGKTIIGLHTHNYSGFITHNFDY
jgi:hypothetical protein